jgi:hypothetical protein
MGADSDAANAGIKPLAPGHKSENSLEEWNYHHASRVPLTPHFSENGTRFSAAQ